MINRMKYTIYCCWLLAFLLVGCSDEKTVETPAVQRVLLFYLGGENNLSAEVTQRMEQLQTAAIASDSRVLIYEDRRGHSPKLWELNTPNGSTNITLICEYEKANSTLTETFSAVLQKVKEYYPAPSYGMVVFSHASGWMPEGTYSNPSTRSVIIDGQAEMDIVDFSSAIPYGMFDFIVFEACHMAGIEVAWELKDKTKYIVASSAEIVTPGFIPLWPELLPLLLAPEPDLEGFIKQAETSYLRRSGDYASLTLSVIDTQALDALANAFRPNMIIDVDLIYALGFSSSEVGKASIQPFDRNNQRLFFDLGDYLRYICPEEDAATISHAIRQAVPYKVSTNAFMPVYGGFDVISHSGLSAYIPQQQYPRLNEAYRQLKWYREVLSPQEKMKQIN